MCMCVCVCMCACVHACACALCVCVLTCMRVVCVLYMCMYVCVCVCVCARACVHACVRACVLPTHTTLVAMHSELPIKGLGVQSQPVVIWCSVFLLAAVAAVTI